MSEYIVEIDGSNSLKNIELAIIGEEATGAEFLKSSISYYNNTITNLATFKDLPSGTRPEFHILLVPEGNSPSSNKSLIWAGVMLVGGSNVAIAAYR